MMVFREYAICYRGAFSIMITYPMPNREQG